MSQAPQTAEPRFVILCLRCDRPLLARPQWVGREVQCPHCFSVLRVPPQPADGQATRAAPPSLAPKRTFNFGCPRCGCLLEAHTGMCGNTGSCPTCAARFNIPYLHQASGQPYPATLVEGDVTDPTPLHAYAASGAEAPTIRRRPDGELEIECPRCKATNSIDSSTCAACGAPFTIEAAPTIEGYRADNRATAALVLGIIAIPTCMLILPGGLAVYFALASMSHGGTSVRAVIGLVLGLLGLAGGATLWLVR